MTAFAQRMPVTDGLVAYAGNILLIHGGSFFYPQILGVAYLAQR